MLLAREGLSMGVLDLECGSHGCDWEEREEWEYICNEWILTGRAPSVRSQAGDHGPGDRCAEVGGGSAPLESDRGCRTRPVKVQTGRDD